MSAIRSTELRVIRHEPDNRFLECAFAADADYIITVNTASGHFDQKQYQSVRVATPGEFLNVNSVSKLVRRIISDRGKIGVLLTGHEFAK